MTAVDFTLDGDFVELNQWPKPTVPRESGRVLGWGDREWIRNDGDLASLHGNPRLRDVPGRIR